MSEKTKMSARMLLADLGVRVNYLNEDQVHPDDRKQVGLALGDIHALLTHLNEILYPLSRMPRIQTKPSDTHWLDKRDE
ncbi:MAG TPA: hypothetical protein VF653_19530 [Methylomirabilota bacterium]